MVLRAFTVDRRHFNNVQNQERRRRFNPTHVSILTWHAIALVYYLYTTMVGGVQATAPNQLVDLSHTFDETTIYWVTAKKLNFTVTHNGTAQGKDYWYQSDEIAAATHGGTHMDAPCHFALGRWCIDDIPIDRLVVSAAVVDISRHVGDNPNVHLSPEHLREWEASHGRIPDGSLLLIRTGWSRFWPDPLTYSGTDERNASLLKFPSIRPEAAKWLMENRDIVGIGVDVMSIDIPGGVPQTHITLMEKNIYGLENVNLQQPLPPTGVKVFVMPMKLRGASGAPCRILADISQAVKSGNVCSSSSMAFIWTMVLISVCLGIIPYRF